MLLHTGTFNYTFLTEKDLKIMPKTYGEFIMYIDARRRAEKTLSEQGNVDNVDKNLHRILG